MPELPEVETITRQLQTVLPGRVIKKVQVLREKSFGGQVDRLIGLSVNQVKRKAKNIIIELDGDLVVLIHLKMTGQLIFDEKIQTTNTKIQTNSKFKNTNAKQVIARIVGGHPTDDWVKSLPSKHTRVIIKFKDGSTLYFNDMRVFGWMKILGMTDFRSQITDRLPPDVIDKEFTVEYLKRVLKSSARPVKLVLLDQAKIGGLGNIYVNDALYLAHAKPTRKANSLKNAEIDRLHKACIQVIRRGIETGGPARALISTLTAWGGSTRTSF